MDHELVSAALDSRQARVDLRGEFSCAAGPFPFRRKAEARTGEGFVSAHDRAPKITSEVELRGKFLRSSEVTAQHVQIEESVIVEVGEPATPRPPDFHYCHCGRLETSHLLEFTAIHLMVEPVPRGRLHKGLLHSRDLGQDAPASLAIHVGDVKILATI